MVQEIISLWYWDPPDNKPAHIPDRPDKFEAVRPLAPLNCDMKDLHDATYDMLEFQPSSTQDLAHTMSVFGQVSQDGNEAKPKSSSYALFTRSGVPVFEYSDPEPFQVSANSPGQFRSSEDILAWATDVVGGDDEELPYQGPNKSDVFMIKELDSARILQKHVSEKKFVLILRFSKVLGVARIIQSVQKLDTIMVQADDDASPSSYEERRTLP